MKHLASESPAGLASTEALIAEIRVGRMVVLVDDEDRENEGDLVMAADAITPEAINFMARFGRGLICLTLTEARCRQLNLPLMVNQNRSSHGTAFTLSIEAAQGVTTGISAADRARTVQAAVAKEARPDDLVQPGHIFPLMAQPGGVLARAGHTEAGCDLAALAGRTPASVICEILNEDGSMARLPDLLPFAAQHGLKVGTIADLIAHRSAHESLVEEVATQQVQLLDKHWQLHAFKDRAVGQPHIALVLGAPEPHRDTLVRVHEPTSLLDWIDLQNPSPPVRHSWSIGAAVRAIADRGCGVLVMLNCAPSSETYFAQLRGERTSAVPPSPASSQALRTYGLGATILKTLGVGRMCLLAKPRKMPSMAGFGLEVTGYQPLDRI
ncbi:MAG: Riboflavin biosynthesis bifunctional protein: cyclohydrase [Pseudomonadota bacterium]